MSVDSHKPAEVDASQIEEVFNIGQRIRTLRGAKNQRDFAAIIDIHKSSLGRYERGESFPNAKDLDKLCQKLDVDPSWLLFGGDRPVFVHKKGRRKAQYCKNCDLLMQLLLNETSARRDQENELRQLVTEVADLKARVGLLDGDKNAKNS